MTKGIANILHGPYLSALEQYRITGPASIRGSNVVTRPVGSSPATPPQNFNESDIRTLIQDLIAAGLIPDPRATVRGGPGLVYFVFPQNGIKYSTPIDIGRHDFFQPFPGTIAYYGWVTNNGTLAFPTAIASHEMVEVFTNPELNNLIGTGGTIPPGQSSEIGDVCESIFGNIDGTTVQSYWSQCDEACIVPLAVLPVQPANMWHPIVPLNTGGVCSPLNPALRGFVEVMTPSGPGVQLTTNSYTDQCCTCFAMSLARPLRTPLNTSIGLISGWWSTESLVPNDSVGSLAFILKNAGSPVASCIFTADVIPPVNKCASAYQRQVPLPNNSRFEILLTTFAPAADFDEVVIRLNSYICGNFGNLVFANLITVGGLQIRVV